MLGMQGCLHFWAGHTVPVCLSRLVISSLDRSCIPLVTRETGLIIRRLQQSFSQTWMLKVGHVVTFSSGQRWSWAEGQDKAGATGSDVAQLVFSCLVSVQLSSGSFLSVGLGTICPSILALLSVLSRKRRSIVKMLPIYCNKWLRRLPPHTPWL